VRSRKGRQHFTVVVALCYHFDMICAVAARESLQTVLWTQLWHFCIHSNHLHAHLSLLFSCRISKSWM